MICIPAIMIIAFRCAYRPVGLAPTAETAKNFEKRIELLRNMSKKNPIRNWDESALCVSTLSSFFSSSASCNMCIRKTLLIVDDASLISSSEMANRIELVNEYESTHLVLCGDPLSGREDMMCFA